MHTYEMLDCQSQINNFPNYLNLKLKYFSFKTQKICLIKAHTFYFFNNSRLVIVQQTDMFFYPIFLTIVLGVLQTGALPNYLATFNLLRQRI